MDSLEEGEMLRRSRMMYIDLVKSLEVIGVDNDEEDGGALVSIQFNLF